MDFRSSSSTSALRQRSAHSHLVNPAAATNTLSWGRSSSRRSWLRSLVAASPGVIAPVFSAATFITIAQFDGSLSKFFAAGCKDGFVGLFIRYGPRPTLKSSLAVLGWVLFEAALFQWLPGPTYTGQRTPSGHLLSYRLNGLSAWIITHVALGALCWFNMVDPGFIPHNWSGLVAAMNIAGFLVSTFAFIKAHLFPTHADDCRFSGSIFYDFYMGIELNPRLGKHFDIKLFSNGRPGIVAWTLIDFSNLAAQYQKQSKVEISLMLITLLHTIYVVDFFVNESWYLRTIDIAHDHYGFYLSWGCFCFLPTMYTIQAQFLGQYPMSPSVPYLAAWFVIGLVGYVIFRSVNVQKDRVRRSNGSCLIWGRPAECIRAEYHTTDGKQHSSLLLCSGWWGWSRHANYVGDLMISYSVCALVGTTMVVVWFYAIWMTMLLVHRCLRDERRCSAKYGGAWEEYCKRVPWRLVPGVW